MFLVHAFETQLCSPVKMEKNKADWDRFVRLLDVSSEQLRGSVGESHMGGRNANHSGLRGPYFTGYRGRIPSGLPLLMGYFRSTTGSVGVGVPMGSASVRSNALPVR